jgi:rhodanese-related sulfurtransferase
MKMMAKAWLGLILGTVLVSGIAACQAPLVPQTPVTAAEASAAPLPAGGTYLKLSPADVQSRKQAGESFVVVDVRSAASYATQHIGGAVSLPLDQIATRSPELPKDRYVLLYCTCPAEASAIAAAEALRTQHGFSRLAVLVGGMNAWLEAGLPIVKPTVVTQP